MPRRAAVAAALAAGLFAVFAPAAEEPAPPEVAREFRGVWVASVSNIDWPSKPGLTTEQQKKELLAILESQGVTVESPLGQPFDPQRHQALAHEPAPGFPEGTVVEVYRKGYSYRDRLLRPALVKVAKDAGMGPVKVH